MSIKIKYEGKSDEKFLDKLGSNRGSGSGAPAEHDHDDRYYTESEIDDLELITLSDIDAICGATTNAQVVTMSEGVF